MKAIFLLGFFVACILFEAVQAANTAAKPDVKFEGEGTYNVPYKVRLADTMKDKHFIHIIGKLKEGAKRVFLDMHKGKDYSDTELPCHMSVRWDEGVLHGRIVYNTMLHGTWADREQRIKHSFKSEGDLDLRIRADGDKLQVFGNRKKIGEFEKRMDIDEVGSLTVGGDYEHLTFLMHHGLGVDDPTALINVQELAPGKRLDISGYPTGNRFDINFFNKDQKNITLNLSVRFKEKAVVRNSFINGEWGKEEREGGLPIEKDKVFDLTVINQSYSFQIYFNGKFYTAYSHRADPRSTKLMTVGGDVDIHAIRLH